MLQHHIDQRMTRLVPGGKLLLLIRHRQAAALAAPADFVPRLFQFLHADRFLVRAGSQQRRFIQKIRQFRA